MLTWTTATCRRSPASLTRWAASGGLTLVAFKAQHLRAIVISQKDRFFSHGEGLVGISKRQNTSARAPFERVGRGWRWSSPWTWPGCAARDE